MLYVVTEESEETLRVTKEVQKRAEEKYKVLENKMKNAEAEREKELKAAQQKLNAAKAKADAFNKKLKQKQQVKLYCPSSPSYIMFDPAAVLFVLFVSKARCYITFLFLLVQTGV